MAGNALNFGDIWRRERPLFLHCNEVFFCGLGVGSLCRFSTGYVPSLEAADGERWHREHFEASSRSSHLNSL